MVLKSYKNVWLQL